MKKSNLILILLVSLVALAARFVPHAPNFSPLIAVMLFSGAYSQNKKYILIPLIALFVSDIFIGFYKIEVMMTVYVSLLVVAYIGHLLNKQKNIINALSASLAAAIIFFVATNWAVWFFGDWYNNNLNGLALSYSLAIPFFKNTLVSTLLYSGLMFSVYEGSQYMIKQKKLLTNK